jgi:pimeloyl-ACP methyl ester carboxylesterase
MAVRRTGVPRYAALAAGLVLAACATPIRVEPLDPREAHRELTASALSADRPSHASQNTLRARGLVTSAKDDPEGALRSLHEIVVSGRGGQEEVFALAELSFLQGTRTRKPEHHLAAAVYAWAFLFPGASDPAPAAFDPRTRVACEIYNQALASAFRVDGRGKIELRGGAFQLPFAQLEVELDPAQLRWAGRDLLDFRGLSELEVQGLRNRYRDAGLGAPLAARTRPAAEAAPDNLVGPRLLAPFTLVLRLDGARAELGSGRLSGRLELFSLDQAESIQVGNQQVPLEMERTAALAATLSDPLLWKLEISGFLGRGEPEHAALPELPILTGVAPHARGRMPVVFVHGTASSAGRWADMVNDLWSSPRLRRQFEPWFFMYDTGNPIAYSGELLRGMLAAKVASLDPSGSDACLRQMVVIGHSQGGLLTKLTAVETGDRLWRAISKKPLDQYKISAETRDLLQRAFFLEPLPSVKRVVFIATPHRGSYQALRSIAGWVTRFIHMPRRLVGLASELSMNTDNLRVAGSMMRVPSSIENMREGNPFLMALASTPVASGIARHSIIPVRTKGPVEKGNDGVVEYRSAHIEDADSELVVHSGHSTQGLPATIEEVRRILELHAQTAAEAGLACGVVVAPGT